VPRHCLGRVSLTHLRRQEVAIEIAIDLMVVGSIPIRPQHDEGPAAVMAVGPQGVGAGLRALFFGGAARAVPDRPERNQLVVGQLAAMDLDEGVG
jgi:hypothetical protein